MKVYLILIRESARMDAKWMHTGRMFDSREAARTDAENDEAIGKAAFYQWRIAECVVSMSEDAS